MLLSTNQNSFPWQFTAVLILLCASFAYSLWKQAGLCFTKVEERDGMRGKTKLKMFSIWWIGLFVTMAGLVFGIGPFVEEGMSEGKIAMTSAKKQVAFVFLAFGLGSLLVMLLWPPPKTKKDLLKRPYQIKTYFPIGVIFGAFILFSSILQIITLSTCDSSVNENNIGVATSSMLIGLGLIVPSITSISISK